MTLFIINPKAGKHKNLTQLEKDIKIFFPEAEITYTKYAGHAKELALQAVQKNYKQVIAVGGDGTINEIIQSLALSNTALGIIPCGSGNGLARELKLPLKNTKKCLEILKNAKYFKSDIAMAGQEYFINLAGIGIEAIIAEKFAASKKRGMTPYFKIGLVEILKFKRNKFSIKIDGSKEEVYQPLSLVFANGKQYGSNFIIAPNASFNDGLLDMVLIPKSNFLKILLGFSNFFKNGSSPIVLTKTKKIKEAEITSKTPFAYHIDGEPRSSQNTLKIKIIPAGLNLLSNKKL